MMGVGRADQGGRYQGVVSSSGWEQRKSTNSGVLASDQGGGRYWGGESYTCHIVLHLSYCVTLVILCFTSNLVLHLSYCQESQMNHES